ncbi:MAG: fatty acid kinase fatty acid binding subunit [Solirubrobacteraceae bacterium]|jgi:DegV family protein with EDD domain|nr:fatty acid kinase fatty acid binding subunit [Solirubrobacteraceae bacterium]
MAPVAVVSDTTHYLPAGVAAANDIRQVSLYVHWQDRDDREADLPDFDEYYEHLRSAPELPTTSQPSVGDFLSCYEPLIDAGCDVVSIHLSAGVSGTYDSALAAKAQLDEAGRGGRIEVMDSATACGGLGLVLLAAAAAARGGGDVEEVVHRTQSAREALKLWFCVDTLEFLRRGGRVGAASAWLGTTLRIKPILRIEAQITPVERVRTAGRAFERMVEYLRSCHDDGADGWVVQHIQAPDVAERLVERGREIFGTEPAFVSEVGPVIGTHVGPGLIGVGGIPSRLMA